MELKIGPIIIDCGISEARVLSEFYSKLLGWKLTHPANNGTAAITSKDGQVLAFQEVTNYVAPTWPWQQDKQGPMLHFDIIVADLEEAINHAIECGAVLAEEKYFADSRTLFDPSGHPFCLDTHTD